MRDLTLILRLSLLLSCSALAARHEMPVHDPGPAFGSVLSAQALGIGPSMDVVCDGDLLYSIGNRQLCIQSGARSGNMQRISTLDGLGNVRQLAVSRGYAFVTSREDGLFIIDVRHPTQPRIACHYDTLELATGLAVAGNLLAVANRFAGIELIDITQPEKPRYLSSLRVGEAQSVVIHGRWLFAGTWSNRAVVIVDLRDPSAPQIVNTLALDGFGDGIAVYGTCLAAATGHHAASRTPPQPGDSAFGAGHGVSFFDIADPAHPQLLSTLKFPPFYRRGMDMWGVVLTQDHAYVNDTHNGFFILDIRTIRAPRVLGYHQLPCPPKKSDPSPVAGIEVCHGRVFLAGAWDDLYRIDTAFSHDAPEPSPDYVYPITPAIRSTSALGPVYTADGSVHAVMPWHDQRLLVAAGSAGLHVVQITSNAFERIATYPTRGFARDVACWSNRVFVAESAGGLSLWQADAHDRLTRIGAYTPGNLSIQNVVLADEGRIAFLAAGANQLRVVRCRPDATFDEILKDAHDGLFYLTPMTPLTPSQDRLLVQWHATGLYEYRIQDSQVFATTNRFAQAMGTECGATPWNTGWIVTSHRGFFYLNDLLQPFSTEKPYRIGSHARPGKPSLDGTTLFIADPFLGRISAVDLRCPQNPQLLAEAQLTGHPGRIQTLTQNAASCALVPAGREGLILWHYGRSPAH